MGSSHGWYSQHRHGRQGWWMTPCARSSTTCMGCHLASADLLMLVLPYSRSCPCRRVRLRIPAGLHIAGLHIELNEAMHSSTTRCSSNWGRSTSWLTSTRLITALRAVRSILTVGGGVRANIFRYPLQKMEMVFLTGEIAVVRHLVDANPHVHTHWN